jgi:hypothetical protein
LAGLKPLGQMLDAVRRRRRGWNGGPGKSLLPTHWTLVSLQATVIALGSLRGELLREDAKERARSIPKFGSSQRMQYGISTGAVARHICILISSVPWEMRCALRLHANRGEI